MVDILSRRLTDIDEAAIRALETGAIAEGLELEYKRELDLGPEKQRREAAKDVSAMANTIGGRLLYGIDEKTLPNGSVVAGPIVPLTDGAVDETLANVLATTIHPHPLVAFGSVPVAGGGFVLVVDVRPSAADLHMVTGYGENRYYTRRLPGRVDRMAEHEVRDRYARVLATRRDLEVRERELMELELKRRANAQESIFVVPVLASSSLVSPGDVNAFRADLERVYLGQQVDNDHQIKALSLRTEADGCRGRAAPQDSDDAYWYLALLRTGVVHWSTNEVLLERDGPHNLASQPLFGRILQALAFALLVHERIGYLGPVRVHYILRAPAPFTIDASTGYRGRFDTPAPAETYRSDPVEAYLSQRGFARLAKQLIDPLFHAYGRTASTLLDSSGRAHAHLRLGLSALLAGMLD